MRRTPNLFAAGTRIDRYEIVRRIGAGGMGSVYEARHVDLGKKVALKVLKPEHVDNDAVLARFLREGQAASRIRHPHVADVYDVGRSDDVAYLVMEYLEGEDLNAHLERVKKLPAQAAADLLVPVLAAVQTAHEEGIVHRDLKPANLFLARGRHGATVPKVLDFGISKLTGSESMHGEAQSLTATATLLGTPYYMSPEQVLGARNATARSDQYALGVLLYRCVTGALPFRGHELYATLRAIDEARYTPPRELAPDLPGGFEAVIGRAMSREAAGRYASLSEMGAALLPFASALIQAQWGHAFGPSHDAAPLSTDPPPPPAEGPTTLGGSVAERALRRGESRPARPWVVASTVLALCLPVAGVYVMRGPAPVAVGLTAAAAPRRDARRAPEPPEAPPASPQPAAEVTPAAVAAPARDALPAQPRRGVVRRAPVRRPQGAPQLQRTSSGSVVLE